MATLPSVARHDIVTKFIAFVLITYHKIGSSSGSKSCFFIRLAQEDNLSGDEDIAGR
jgi:hypothetical protein